MSLKEKYYSMSFEKKYKWGGVGLIILGIFMFLIMKGFPSYTGSGFKWGNIGIFLMIVGSCILYSCWDKMEDCSKFRLKIFLFGLLICASWVFVLVTIMTVDKRTSYVGSLLFLGLYFGLFISKFISQKSRE